ncbi:Aste57867_9010 [Aphanomyces stellatus]|uniref:Aste57867_9010 protein n=1 Tax=Aphanomyces stellatus TaxID=120398 RepID=A0A485KM50_9STRA|nr:hypothetical protein As57867_008975 [Aphanomyces stellatus]VFT85894.1 Aste57867_9010 [Aphanomyces stellatus]
MVDDLQSSEELAFVAEEVDRIILQSVEYFLKDRSYDEDEVSHWVDSICDGIMKGLGDLRKPLKYIGTSDQRTSSSPAVPSELRDHAKKWGGNTFGRVMPLGHSHRW